MKARQLKVWTPPPPPNDDEPGNGNEWWRRGYTGRWVLTEAGWRETRSAIHEEQDQRAKKLDLRIKRFSIIGSVVLALIGALISILKK